MVACNKIFSCDLSKSMAREKEKNRTTDFPWGYSRKSSVELCRLHFKPLSTLLMTKICDFLSNSDPVKNVITYYDRCGWHSCPKHEI